MPTSLRAIAGPALIVGTVLVVGQRFLFGRLLPTQWDILGEWLPYYCFLGKSLGSGHIPAWIPSVMGGSPFAADPSNGWMNLEAMALFSFLRCDVALRIYLLLQPLVAGVGLYWFLRGERLSRVAATLGGLALALPIAGSKYFALPWLSASLAWTAILLASACRFFRAQAWPRRLVWAGVTAVAWGQVAAVHLSNGFVLASVTLLLYASGRLIFEVRSRARPPRDAWLVVAVLLAALPLLNLAYFVPRLAYLPRTTVGLGYQKLSSLSLAYSHGQSSGAAIRAQKLRAWWPLTLSLSPGAYAGGAVLLLLFAGWWRRGARHLMLPFALLGLVSYALTFPALARSAIAYLPSALGGTYLHAPDQFRFGLLLAVAVLAALGLEAWGDPQSRLRRAAMISPALVVWAGMPLVLGAPLIRMLLFAAGVTLGAVALIGAVIRPRFAIAVSLVVAAELAVNGVVGQDPARRVLPQPDRVTPIDAPTVRTFDIAAYARPGPIARALQSRRGARYLSVDPDHWRRWGYLGRQAPRFWGLMGSQRAPLFGLEEAQGYNSIQLARYWKFVRKVEPKDLRYASAYFIHPPRVALDLLHVGWLIAPAVKPPLQGAVETAREGHWALYRLRMAPPRASVLGSWRVAPSADAALGVVASPRFNPAREAVIERDSGLHERPDVAAPGSASVSASGTASYRWVGPQRARIDVSASAPAVLVVRNSYDPHWHATLDGRPVRVLAADYAIQGVPIPAGRHVVVLSYDDPWVGYGLLGSALALSALIAAAVVLRRRDEGMRPERTEVGGTDGPVSSPPW